MLSANGRRFQANPPLFVAQRLRAMLESRDIEVRRAARAKRAPGSAQSIATARSAPIASLVRHTNQTSDNYYAEMLVKGLGARLGGFGSTVAGTAVIKRFLSALGVSANVLDGSGLSRGDAVSPEAVVRLLRAARKKPWFDAFYRSLPLAGRSGTLRKRMRGTSAAGRCRAKTGTLIGISALAGYCRSLRNHTIAFAIIMNGIDVARARRSQDRIAAALAAYSGG
jgi:D-alanyl-D-alanine carboxypeptidase/D-alanyl-D-alanine-endopeptidase (penicillin-binding protein 4)